MLLSRTLTLQIARPVDEVFQFLQEPRNYPKWAASLGGRFEHIGGRDWRADTPNGPLIIRFAQPNTLGVLDHAVFREGDEPLQRRARVVPNGEGTEFIYTLFAPDGMSVDRFTSETEWIATELEVLKTYLELRN